MTLKCGWIFTDKESEDSESDEEVTNQPICKKSNQLSARLKPSPHVKTCSTDRKSDDLVATCSGEKLDCIDSGKVKLSSEG